MKNLKFKLTSTVPLLMHNDTLSNPLHPTTKRMKEITGKRKKTDEDIELMSEIEFLSSLYHDDETGYHLPSRVIDSALIVSAKQFKLGTAFKQACFVDSDAPLDFPNKNKSPIQLFAIPEYRDLRSVKVGQAKIIRCRPIIKNWTTEISVNVDEAKLSIGEVEQIVTNAGLYVGFCDYRPRYGRFSVEKLYG